MDTAYSSGEEFVVKTRKPYTITKQRERWTEDEHNRFLEALKLYGRAWQRIEEHIGTKTAVQIRSHAQKFFSKLEKEALVKGVPIGQTLDIDIPPPRPKRKPSNPYPRKTCQGTPMSLVGAKDGKFLSSESSHSKQMLDLEKEQLREKPGGEGKITHDKENQSDNCSEVLTQLQGTHYSSACNSSAPKPPVGLGNACSFREFVPSFRKTNQDDTNCSYVTVELTRSQNVQKPDAKDMIIEDSDTSNGLLLEETNALSEKFVAGDKMGSDFNCGLPTEEMQATQNYPRHVPVHVVDGSLGTSQNHSPDMPFREPKFHPGLVGDVHGHPNFFASSAASATTEHLTNAPRSSGQQSFQPFNPSLTSTCPNQEDYQSFLHMSSTFSSLILSTLLQNPAAHAAASFAATFWPYSNGKASADSPELNQGGFSLRQSNSAPSMAAIAAATVAAATAWWASHGLLPLCAPLHTTFTCTTPVGGAPSIETSQVLAAKTGENSLNPPLQDQMEPEYAEALQNQHSASKSSSNSEEIGAAKLNPSEGSKLNSNSKDAADDNAAETAELQDSEKAKGGKQVDRSSCGSNTASSSDIETDALGKKENGVEELKEPENSNPISDTNIRRSRSNSNSTDSWKEVSEEGRLAFQALFSREVLPQSFSPPPNMKTQENQNDSMKLDRENKEKDGVTSLLDLNIKAWGFCFNLDESEKNGSPTGDKLADGQLTMGIGQGRFKARRTGFKPYKRCSVEAKENRVGNPGCQVEEKGTKRIRLEGEVQL